jgi:hypothetical protein
MPAASQLIQQVPRHRRSSTMSVLLFAAVVLGLVVPMSAEFWLPMVLVVPMRLASLALSGLALLAVCVVVLTGPVYFAAFDDKAQLKTWGVGNKIVAVLLLLSWGYFLVRFVLSLFAG